MAVVSSSSSTATSTRTNTNVGGKTQTIDWEHFFDASGNELALPGCSS
jgi:hypothetical protein